MLMLWQQLTLMIPVLTFYEEHYLNTFRTLNKIPSLHLTLSHISLRHLINYLPSSQFSLYPTDFDQEIVQLGFCLTSEDQFVSRDVYFCRQQADTLVSNEDEKLITSFTFSSRSNQWRHGVELIGTKSCTVFCLYKSFIFASGKRIHHNMLKFPH